MRRIYDRLRWLLLEAETAPTRLWLSLSGLLMASDVLVSSGQPEYKSLVILMPGAVWAALFITHGVSLMYGVLTRKYNKVLLVLEGILGTALWSSSAVIMFFFQGGPDATLAGACAAFWLLIRYPTHWEYTDGK